ncbi:hypothetical protein [Streptomyces palmae]|uniref:Secreted protein n=1 Tax=Streptomyces palmae TaxID=1701085 RepID=A0A4Z0HHG3_9ACTN|nr:hypothetical protein [Streptomyces palmae]TGB19608.1 hypothetical protein E4099_00210 [Streptomyces palmae]
MRIRTRAALAAVPVMLTLVLTSCGSDGGGDDVASAGGGRKDNNPSGKADLSRDEITKMNLRFARCLRRHGLDVEDPKPGEGLGLSVNGDNKAKADQAMEACRGDAPPAPSDEGNAKEREEMLEFARCMRENGVESFKDPKPGQGIGIGPAQGEDPDYKKAVKKCGGVGDTNSRRAVR